MKCNAAVNGRRCDYDGDELTEHAVEAGHPLCILCNRSLRPGEIQTCDRCVQRTRDALIGIRQIDLEPIIEASALHPGTLPGGDALVMVADGNAAALKPYKPGVVTDRTPTTYPEIPAEPETIHYWQYDRVLGARVRKEFTRSNTHPPFVDTRPEPDGKEHYGDHWPKDPSVPLAVLSNNCRDWRCEFGHPPAEPIDTIQNTTEYLLTHLMLAAKTHPAFEEFAKEIQGMHSQMRHVAGLADDPVEATATCFDCGGELIRDYRPPIAPVTRRRQGHTFEGLPDEWTCRRCHREYEPSEYWLAVRAVLEQTAEQAG